MSEWNLSVRLSGQGDGLSRTLRDTSRDARAASRDVNALRRDITRLRTEASNDIRITARLDTGNLRQEVRDAVRAASGETLRLDLQLGDTMQLRRDVQNAVRWASWGHRIEIPIGLRDPNQLRRDVTAAVRAASTGQRIRVRVDPDTSSLTRLRTAGAPGPRVGGGSSGGGGFDLNGFLTLAPAAIPLAAGLASTIAPLAGQFAAAGVGATAFGIALAGQVGPLNDAAEAQKKYQQAVAQYGTGSQQAMEAGAAYAASLAVLPPATREAAAALAQLKGDYRDWSDSLSQFTMEPVTKGLQAVDALLPHLTPEVKSASTQLTRLVDVAGGSINTPGFDRLSTRIASFTDGQLDHLTDEVIHFMRVVSEGNADDGALGQILDYARENGPAARQAIRSISEAVITLAQGAAQAGPGLLTLVTGAAQLVAALPPELVGIIISVASALKLLQLSGAGMAALAGGIARVQASIAALAATSAAAGGGLAGLRAAFLSLGVAARASIVVAGIAAVAFAVSKLSRIGKEAPADVDKLTTSLGRLGSTGRVTGEAARVFGEDFSKLGDEINKVLNPSVADSINNWGAKWSGGLLDASDSTEDFTQHMEALDESLTNLVRGGKADLAKDALAKALKGMSPQQIAKVKASLTNYKQALADVKFEQEHTASSMGIFGQAAADVGLKLGSQKAAADGLRASIVALNDANRSAYDAEIGFEASVDALTASFKENGNNLDIHTAKGRKNGQAMSAAAKAHDELLTSGLAAGESLGSMQKKSESLRTTMLSLATATYGNKKAATEYVNKLLGTPKKVETFIRLERTNAISGLNEVQSAITKTPNAKRITVSTLNAAAINALEAVGLKTKQLPDGRTAVYTANGQSLGSIGAVRRALAALDGKRADTYTTNHVLTIRETRAVYSTVGRPTKGEGGVSKYSYGGLVARAADGLFVPGYAPRVDKVSALLSPGEGVLVPETVAKLGTSTGLGRAGVIDAMNQWGRYGRLNGRLDPRMGFADGGMVPQRFADGGLSFSYSGSGGSAQKYTLSGLLSASNDKKGNFSLSIFTSKLKASNNALAAWRSNLAIVASRAGQDVADALEEMGDEGIALTKKMAHGSSKYVKEMAGELKKLSNAAKASLGEYTSQLKDAVKDQAAFQANLATLAGQGYGALAGRLASQGDQAAEELAAAAVKDKKKASSANSAAVAADKALSSDQLEQLVQIIGAITTSKTGIHDVAAASGLGEDVIIDVATKASAQIKSSLGSRATKFLADLGKAQKHMAYADGGIRSGIYATQAGAVTFAEPSTGGEAFIPLGAAKRASALPVLADVAHRFGVGLTDSRSNMRQVVNNYHGSPVNTHVTTNVTSKQVADEIGKEVGRAVRKANRGGVGNRYPSW